MRKILDKYNILRVTFRSAAGGAAMAFKISQVTDIGDYSQFSILVKQPRLDDMRRAIGSAKSGVKSCASPPKEARLKAPR